MAMNFPGMTPGGQPLPSTDPVIPNSLISPQTVEKIKQALTSTQMSAMASDPNAEAVMTRLVDKMLIDAAKKTMEAMDKTQSGHQRLSRLADTLASTDASGAPPTPGVPAAARIGRPSYAGPQPLPSGGGTADYTPQTLRQHYQEGRSTTMGGLARQVSGALATTISQRTSNWKTMEDGTLQQVLPDPSSPDGLGTIPDPNGRTVRPGDHDYERTVRSVARGKMLSNALTKVSTGDAALTGRIGMLAGRAAGGVGLAVTAVQMGGKFLEGQRNQAASYRQAFGDQGTGAFAAKDRFGEFMAGLSGFGTIGGGRAREEYQAASAMGLRGTRRDAATDFSRDMFMKFGMDTQESMQIVEQATKQGNISLKAYADAIKAVSKTAVDSGRTASEAAHELVAAQNLAAQQGVTGNAGLSLARSATMASSGMDRETSAAFGGASGMLGATMSRSNIMLSASMTGQDPVQALWRAQAGGTYSTSQAATTNAGAAASVVDQIVAMYQSSNPTITAAQMRREAKGVTEPITQQEINKNWAGSEDAAYEGLRVMMGLLQHHGYNPKDTGDALKMFFAMLNGDTTKNDNPGGGISRKDAISYKGKDSLSTRDSIVSGVMGPYHGPAAGVNAARAAIGANKTVQAYTDYVQKSGGTGSRAIEALIRGDGGLGKFTGKNVEDSKFKVKDKDGKYVTKSLSEIIGNDTYRSQIATGDALVIGAGGHDQKRVSAFTGIDTNGGPSDVSPKSPKKSKGGDTQKVQVEFTGWAQRFLQVSGPTAADRAGMPGNSGYNPDAPAPTGGN